MRYYSYNDYETDPSVDSYVAIKSEEDIRKEYYPYWYERMCHKFGKEHVDKNYTFNDCIQDWIIVNWAWEIESETTNY
jgi:hypothetical protein